ncbi:hypothetical protein HYPSUDRAFT_205166 [Hypholoma sublateritium FD-334 SS-4]|uniref:Uncharacterized protein n=1 Tax=Hypholoma sublateritium (strain FD-334 SS-4) TaxID=945553 RepID=A0A0D2KVG1_HYPSF|nr:hypothetical protein HYPSUDRAFT_205166 [Hypholoma sublateritium FD-334 SS-4]
MPTSAAERYLSTIAPEVEFQPCTEGFRHTVRVCMGTKIPQEIGRRYIWCHGGNRDCNVKGPMLTIAERDVLRKKVKDFKMRLKEDKKDVSSVSSPGMQKKRRAQSLPEESSEEEQASDTEQNDTVKVHMYFGDNASESHDSVVVDGMYSFRADKRFCEWSSWPEVRWLMFDVVQKIWVDIPTLARIEVGFGPLLTRQNDPDADLTTYEGLDSLIKKALDTYTLTIENPRFSAPTRRVLPSSQTTSEAAPPTAGSSKSRKRARKC